jgi:hypothetical protein
VPQLLQLYQQLRMAKLSAAGVAAGTSRSVRPAGKGRSAASHVGCTAGPDGGDAQAAAMFQDIMHKGGYQSKVQADLDAHAPALAQLAATIAAFKPADMAEVCSFATRVQREQLDQLYDERAVLKRVPEWESVAAKWEALWEACVLHEQLTCLAQTCQAVAVQQQSQPGGKAAATAAVAAAQAAYSRVVARVELFQRQESAVEKRLRAQGVPWAGQQLLCGIKEAAVQLGTAYVHAVLALLQDASQQLAQAQAQLGSGSSTTMWGCAVRDPRQAQRLGRQLREQAQQAVRRRERALDEAVTFLFKLHQFAGGFDGPCTQAFLCLAAEVQEQQQQPAAAVVAA